jgi:tellurite resistance protein
MQSTAQSSNTDEQISVWLRGLLNLAWADGDFDQTEQQLITSITHHELSDEETSVSYRAVSLEDLSATFKPNPQLAENFLRTAVMVALADGVYSTYEDQILQQYCEAVGCCSDILETLRLTLCEVKTEPETGDTTLIPHPEVHHDLLEPVRGWLDRLDIHDPKIAHFICKSIPAQCPFERDITLFGHKVVHIPPMCKLNPLYEQLVGLRFRALSYLADECGEDVTPYC